jgi:hypothetical protein
MKKWTELVECKLQKQKNNIAKISLDKATVWYSEKVKQNGSSGFKVIRKTNVSPCIAFRLNS